MPRYLGKPEVVNENLLELRLELSVYWLENYSLAIAHGNIEENLNGSA